MEHYLDHHERRARTQSNQLDDARMLKPHHNVGLAQKLFPARMGFIVAVVVVFAGVTFDQ